MNMMGTPGQCQMDRGLWKRRAQQDPWISTGSLPAPMNWKRPHEGKKVCWKWSKQKINITYYIIVYDLFDLYFVCTKNSINTLLEKKKKKQGEYTKMFLLPYVFFKHWADVPGRAEGGEAFAEALVVNGSRVDGEQSHQQNQIPSTEHHPPDLTHKVVKDMF